MVSRMVCSCVARAVASASLAIARASAASARRRTGRPARRHATGEPLPHRDPHPTDVLVQQPARGLQSQRAAVLVQQGDGDVVHTRHR